MYTLCTHSVGNPLIYGIVSKSNNPTCFFFSQGKCKVFNQLLFISVVVLERTKVYL